MKPDTLKQYAAQLFHKSNEGCTKDTILYYLEKGIEWYKEKQSFNCNDVKKVHGIDYPLNREHDSTS